MVKVILQATEINKPVQPKLRELFTREEIYHYIVWHSVLTDYTDAERVAEFYMEGANEVLNIVRKHKNAEYYIITSGGVLHGIVLDRLLRTQGVEPKLIAYENEIGKYVVLPIDIYGVDK